MSPSELSCLRPRAKKTKALRSCLQRSQKIMWRMGRRIQAFWWRERLGSEGGAVGGNSLERKRAAVLQVDFTALELLILVTHSLLVLAYYASSVIRWNCYKLFCFIVVQSNGSVENRPCKHSWASDMWLSSIYIYTLANLSYLGQRIMTNHLSWCRDYK